MVVVKMLDLGLKLNLNRIWCDFFLLLSSLQVPVADNADVVVVVYATDCLSERFYSISSAFFHHSHLDGTFFRIEFSN